MCRYARSSLVQSGSIPCADARISEAGICFILADLVHQGLCRSVHGGRRKNLYKEMARHGECLTETWWN
jgi:hypothetical protein